MDNEKRRYKLDGAMCLFDNLIDGNVHGTTMAVSKAKAKSNFEYNYKKNHNMLPTSKVTFKGTITEI